LIEKSNLLYRLISRNLTPSTELFSLTAPPSSRAVRGIDISRLALYSVLALLLALPLTIVGCLLHNRVHEEDVEERYLHPERALTD
jgi:hypothetical protein